MPFGRQWLDDEAVDSGEDQDFAREAGHDAVRGLRSRLTGARDGENCCKRQELGQSHEPRLVTTATLRWPFRG